MSQTTLKAVYSFRLTLNGVAELTVEVGDSLYAIIDDASLWSEGPTIYLDFHREAESLADAVGTAIRDVERAGFAVARVDVGRVTVGEQIPNATTREAMMEMESGGKGLTFYGTPGEMLDDLWETS